MNETYIHMAGHAHVDPVWLWRWPEGFQEVKATFRSALDRMQEDDDFVFGASSACFYHWVERSDPALFREIQARVTEGRWELLGGWWVEPDCNIPSGESFARQALYGQGYFRQAFGQTATVGFNADSFGHNGTLPQILQLSGLQYYVFTRPTPHNRALPNRCFWWYSGDGSRVLAFRIPYEYLSWGQELAPHVQRCAALIRRPQRRILCFYGVGNHGGGPTRENILSIQRLRAAKDTSQRVDFSRIDTFFAAYLGDHSDIPAVHEDLQHQASGCYAAHSQIKRTNRQTERMLQNAELWGITALWIAGISCGDLRHAWQQLLFTQFHDILAGTSIPGAYDDAEHMLGEARALAQRHLHRSLQSISGALPGCIPAHSKSIVVFNDHSWPLRAVVEWETRACGHNVPTVDAMGVEMPWQEIHSQTLTQGRERRCFVVDLPAWGWAVYGLGAEADARRVRTDTPGSSETAAVCLPDRRYSPEDLTLETSRWHLTFDRTTGAIAQWLDKSLEHHVFHGLAAHPVVMADPSDTWSHGILQYHEVVGQFQLTGIHCTEDGPVRTAVVVESCCASSTLRQTFFVYAHTERVDVQVNVDWREQHRILKLLFPVNAAFASGTYDVGYGVQERALNGEEEPGHTWIDISGMIPKTHQGCGVSLLNDGKYSFHMRNTEMAITAVRSPVAAHHDPEPLDTAEDYPYLDQGHQEFWYSILPHDGDWRRAGTVQQAAQLNQAPIVIPHVGKHTAIQPLRQSFVNISARNVIVCAVKKSEDSDDLILRCREVAQQAVDAVIELPVWNRRICVRFRPEEIKSFRIPRSPEQPWVLVNLLEEPI